MLYFKWEKKIYALFHLLLIYKVKEWIKGACKGNASLF